MLDFDDWKSVARYLAGESTPAERRQMEDHLAKDPELRAVMSQLEHMWRLPGPALPADTPDVEASWQRMRRRLQSVRAQAPEDQRWEEAALEKPRLQTNARFKNRPPRPAGRRVRSTERSRLGWAVRSAAAGAVVVLMALGIHLALGPDEPDGPTPPTLQQVVTERAERATYQLSDGTRIVLNAASRIRVPYTFEADGREVYLEGEAYFDVAPDANRPFRVYTETGRVEVLGTAFTMRAYEDDAAVQVVVAEGRVAFGQARGAAPPVVLRPGQRGRLQQDGAVLTDSVNTARYTSWTEGRLVFDDAPFDEVVRRLEQWYDLDIETHVSATSVRRFNGAFEDESVSEILVTVASSLNLTFDRHQRHITFYPAGSAPGRP